MLAAVEDARQEAKKVLVVDDEPQILDSLEDLLEENFQVLKALRGGEGLEILKAEEDVAVEPISKLSE